MPVRIDPVRGGTMSSRPLSALFVEQTFLPAYRRERAPAVRLLQKLLFLLFCVVLGLAYGFYFAVIPPQLLVFLGYPILGLALVVVWALPDTGRAPTRALSIAFGIYIAVLVLWPRYLAIQIAGLPWLSLRRLIAFPMGFLFLFSISISHQFRTELAERLRAVKPLSIACLGFAIIQVLTIAASKSPSNSIGDVLDFWFCGLLCFLVGSWVISNQRGIARIVDRLLLFSMIVCIIGILEYHNQKVLWANHIPSFLKMEEGELTRYLSTRSRDGEYRVASTFAHPLLMAEYLAIVTPFAIHKMFTSKSMWGRCLWALIDIGLLGGVNLPQSRLGVLGWIVAHAVYIGLWAFRRWHRHRTEILAPVVSLIYPVAASLFFVGMFTVPAIRNRTIGGGSTSLSDDARKEQFALLWPKLWHNPFGYGAGNSGRTLQFYSPSGVMTVDSYVITALIDYGIAGFALFFFMYVYSIFSLSTAYWRNERPELDLALPLAAAIAVELEVRLVLSQTDNLPIEFALFGLCAALLWIFKRGDGHGRDRGAHQAVTN
jgi:hypothetical protein